MINVIRSTRGRLEGSNENYRRITADATFGSLINRSYRTSRIDQSKLVYVLDGRFDRASLFENEFKLTFQIKRIQRIFSAEKFSTSEFGIPRIYFTTDLIDL